MPSCATSPPPLCPANVGAPLADHPEGDGASRGPAPIMIPRAAIIALLLALLAAAPAGAASSSFVIRGAGFGHGVGMSQYGAMGYAQHGVGYRDILDHYYTGTQVST